MAIQTSFSSAVNPIDKNTQIAYIIRERDHKCVWPVYRWIYRRTCSCLIITVNCIWQTPETRLKYLPLFAANVHAEHRLKFKFDVSNVQHSTFAEQIPVRPIAFSKCAIRFNRVKSGWGSGLGNCHHCSVGCVWQQWTNERRQGGDSCCVDSDFQFLRIKFKKTSLLTSYIIFTWIDLAVALLSKPISSLC